MATPPAAHFDTDVTSQLRQAVRQADSGTFLVEPRVTRRVVRELHSFARLSPRIPHTDVQLVAASRVRQLTHPDELGLESFDGLPDPVLLIALPEEHETRGRSVQDQMAIVWRRLFHGAVDRAVQAAFSSGRLTRASVQKSIDQIGQVEFDEVHSVLAAELRLIHPESRSEAFAEFIAIWWELSRFAPDLIPIWFPSLAGRDPASLIPDVRIDPDLLYVATRLYGAPDPDTTPQINLDETQLSGVRQDWIESGPTRPSERRYERQRTRRDRATERGNSVAAGLAAMQAAEVATTPEQREQALEIAESDISAVVRRLQSALTFDDSEIETWHSSLRELFRNSTHGFWNADKKLLHDLQKVCLDNERVTYKVDLVKWIVSRGRRPLRRALSNLREVMMAKHLASSASRLVYVRLSGAEREQLTSLLHEAAQLAEVQMRERMRPALRQTLLDVGLRPGNIPEEVAFDKLIEESLDCIAYRGYLTMGYLRDSISRNDLKLADLTDPAELFRGDHLLRADDRLDVALDGVYRRGEFYLRGLQRVSSLAFGTRRGRFVTQFVVIPFGGALIIVEGVSHLVELFFPTAVTGETDISETIPDGVPSTTDEVVSEQEVEPLDQEIAASKGTETESTTTVESTAKDTSELTATVQQQISHVAHRDHLLTPTARYSLIVAIGLVVMATVHLPVLRQTLGSLLHSGWRLLHWLVWRVPTMILQYPPVQWLWRSSLVANIRRYLVGPGIVAWGIGIALPTIVGAEPLPTTTTVVLGLLLSLAFNSRLGRDTEELAAEWIGNAIHNLRARVVMAAFDWIVDFFKWALATIERFIYAVDEWLRFHSEESWPTIIVKAVFGVVWSFVVFLIRIYVNLLIEPQVNPIKHFPVVTVAHKIILPLTPFVVEEGRGLLENFIGPVLANSVVATTWFLFPGVFGFLVWELKENWRLYSSNRVSKLQPVVVGGHGETTPRLLRPGFHSGTLPKAYARLRRLERQAPSFRRFSQRRAWQDVLHHAERDVRRFVERDLIRLLEYCPPWQDVQLRLTEIHVACNSVRLTLDCDEIDGDPVEILLQEQNYWIVGTVAEPGFLRAISAARLHSFDTALLGFYRKAGVELVREQLQRNFVGRHPYDVCQEGLIIWPEGQYDREVTVDLNRPHQLKPLPATLAITFGIGITSAESVIFSKSNTNWYEWAQLWHVNARNTDGDRLPLACVQSARLSLLPHD